MQKGFLDALAALDYLKKLKRALEVVSGVHFLHISSSKKNLYFKYNQFLLPKLSSNTFLNQRLACSWCLFLCCTEKIQITKRQIKPFKFKTAAKLMFTVHVDIHNSLNNYQTGKRMMQK